MMKPTTKMEKTIADFAEVVKAGFDRKEMETTTFVRTPTKVYKITCKSEDTGNRRTSKAPVGYRPFRNEMAKMAQHDAEQTNGGSVQLITINRGFEKGRPVSVLDVNGRDFLDYYDREHYFEHILSSFGEGKYRMYLIPVSDVENTTKKGE